MLVVNSRNIPTLNGVAWPASLQQLTFGRVINTSLQGSVLPASLLELALGGKFNKSVHRMTWPESLEHLAFGRSFNLWITFVKWPKHLILLSFGYVFNQPIEGVMLRRRLSRSSRLGNAPTSQFKRSRGRIRCGRCGLASALNSQYTVSSGQRRCVTFRLEFRQTPCRRGEGSSRRSARSLIRRNGLRRCGGS